MGFNIFNRIIEFFYDLMAGQADQALAETITTISRASVGRQYQSGWFVLMLEAGHFRVFDLAAGIIRTGQVQFFG